MKATYHPTPDETCECGYCRYRGSLCDFLLDGGVDDGSDESECPNCGDDYESPPLLDAEQKAMEAAAATHPDECKCCACEGIREVAALQPKKEPV